MKLAIKTTKSRDTNGNTTYRATCQGKSVRQQKDLSMGDIDNHVDIASKLLEKMLIDAPFDGGVHDDKTMVFLVDYKG